MLEQIIQAVQGQAADYFRQHPDIPNEQAEGAAQAAGASIMPYKTKLPVATSKGYKICYRAATLMATPWGKLCNKPQVC